MKEVNHKELVEILKIARERKISYFIWGKSGIGKSYLIKELAKELSKEENKEFIEWNKLSRGGKIKVFQNLEKYFIFVDLRASQVDLGDLRLPKLNEEFFEWEIPFIFRVLCDDRCFGILFFDEFNLAPQSIMAMFYQIINDRMIGEWKISDNVFIVGAGNDFDDRSFVNEMPLPLLNRFGHLRLKVPTIEEWTEWGLRNKIDNRIIAFLNFKPSYLHKYPSENSNEKSFPTPRSWERLNIMIKDLNDLDLIENISNSLVGEAVSIEFINFLKLSREINIKEILENPEEKLKEILKNKDNSLIYSIIGELGNIYSREKEKEKIFDNMAKIVKILEENKKVEFCMLFLKMMKEADRKVFDLFDKKYHGFVDRFKKYLI